jgi:hypothetical protein
MFTFKRIGLILLFLTICLGIYEAGKYITIEGLKLNKTKLTVEKATIKLPYTELKLFNLQVGIEGIKTNTLVVNIDVPSVKGVEKKSFSSWETVKDTLDLVFKILRKIPVNISIKNGYININKQVSINVYYFKFQNKKAYSSLIRVFLDSSNAIEFTNIKLTLHKTAKLEFFIRYKDINLKNSIFYNSKNLEIFSEGNFYKRPLKIYSFLTISKLLKGTLKIYLPSEGYISYIKITSLNFVRYNFVSKIFKKNFKIFEGVLNIHQNYFNLKGFLNLCQEDKVPLNLSYKNGYLYFSLEDLSNLIYLTLSFSLPKKEIFTLASNGSNGLLQINGYLNDFKVLIKEFNLKNFCGLHMEKVSVKGISTKNRLTLKGSFKELSYKSFFSLNQQRFSIISKKKLLSIKLQKTLNGFLLVKNGNFWGYLNGKLTVLGNLLTIQIPLLEGILKRQKILNRIYFKTLSYKDISLVNTEILTKIYSKTVNIKFNKQANGKFFIKLNPFNFYGNFEIPLKIFKKFYILSLKGKGNKNNGLIKLKSNFCILQINYKNSIVKYKFLSDFLTSTGEILINSFKNFKFTLLNEIGDNLLNISAVIPIIGEVNTQKPNLSIKVLPFCSFYRTQKVLCIKTASFIYNQSRAIININSLKNLPVFIKINSSLKNNYLSLEAFLNIKKEFLNLYLAKLKTLIKSPQEVKLNFTYKGKIGKLIQNFKWFYSQKFDIFSDYTYKPLAIYVNMSFTNKKFESFLGLLNSFNQLPIGRAYLSYSPKNGLNFNYALEEFPLKINIPKRVKAFLKITSNGKLKLTPSRKIFQGNLGLGGYIHILSYDINFNKNKKESKEDNKNFNLKYKLNIFSLEPIFIKIPDGSLALNLSGFITDKRKKLDIRLSYGFLKVSDKKFNIVEGLVKIRNTTSLDILLSNYTPDRTIFLKIYGELPVENLKFHIYSIPPLPQSELFTYMFGNNIGSEGLNNLPFTKKLIQSGYSQIGHLASNLSSSLVSGINIRFIPSFDPKEGFLFGVDIEKQFSNYLRMGYHWLPSNNPKSTYLWGSMRFLFNSFLRLQRYADSSESLTIRFFKTFGKPF